MDIFGLRKILLQFLLFSLFSTGLFAYEMDDCISCHSDNPGSGIPQISIKDYQSSVHGSMMECSNCHTYIEEGHEAGDITETVDCGNCHSLKNLHGASSGKDNKPECYSCHTKHNILPESDEYSSINKNQLKDTCKKCHTVEWGEQGFLRGIASVRIKSHKKQDFSRNFDETNCIGCHQGKAIHGNPEKIYDDECFKCHMKENKNAMIGNFHSTGNSGSSIMGILMIALIIAVLFIVAGFIILPLEKSGKGKE